MVYTNKAVQISVSSCGMTPRLLAAASLVRRDSPCVDVGTDHGYLAAYIFNTGISSNVIACDINQGPLSAARRRLTELQIEGKVPLFLSNGLQAIDQSLAKDVIICGMGGELILRIILDVGYTREKDRRFILQPMTNISLLRRGLYANGFHIEREIPVFEGRHCYTVMQAQYTGEEVEVTDFFALTGKLLESKLPERYGLLKLLLLREERIYFGLLNATEKNEGEIKLHYSLIEELKAHLSERNEAGE